MKEESDSETGGERRESTADANAASDGAETMASGDSSLDDASGSGASLSADLRSIRELLERTGRRDRLAALLEGSVWYLAALGAVAMSAALLGLLAPSTAPVVTGWILLGGSVVVGLAALGSAVRYLRRSMPARRIARRLQRIDRSFRNDLVAALEFGESLTGRPEASDDELGFSRRLAREHVTRTLRVLKDRANGAGHLGDLLPDRHFTPPLVALAGGIALLSGVGLVVPDRMAGVFESPFEASASSENDRRVRPIVGDIRLTYAPPRYTGRGQATETHSTGHIETVAGSEVTLVTYPLMEVASVEMVIDSDDGERVVPLRRNDAGQLEKTLVLTNSGTYHFRATLPDGTEVTDGMERRIELKEDAAPEVAITSHDGTVEVSPKDVLEIEYRVEDDFGLDAVERVHYFEGGSDNQTVRSVDAPSLSETPKSVESSLELDLRSLGLEPKDVVVFYMQATDNNSRTGPGIGKSEKIELKVTSLEDKHLEIVRAQRELSDQLLALLGDYLENPIGERVPRDDGTYDQVVRSTLEPSTLGGRLKVLRKILGRERDVLDDMTSLVDRMKDDPLMVERNLSLFEGLHEQLRELHERGESIVDALKTDSGNVPARVPRSRAEDAAAFAADMEENLEKAVLRLLEMVASQKMDAVQATRKDIEELKNRLEKLMKRYKESNDPELKKDIEREINRLKQRMSELMSRMQMQIGDLPEKHLNEEALEQAELQSDSKKLSNNLESMEKKFEQGDIDGALKQLDQMSSKLSSFGEQMDRQFSSAQPKGMSKLDKKVSELMNDVNDLKSAEKNVEEKTKKLKRKTQRQREQKIDEMLDEFTERMKNKVDKQIESLEQVAREELDRPSASKLDEQRESLRKLQKRLEQKDMQKSLEAARDSVEKLRTMRFNMNLSERRADQGSKRRREIERAKQKLGEMLPRGKQIQRDIDRMMDRAQKQLKQGSSPEMKRLSRKQKKISERAQKLKKKIGEASKEFPMLKQQLEPSLKGAKKNMGEAQRRLSKGKPQGALDSERSALEELGKLQKAMRRTMRNKRKQKRGRSGMRDKDVEIPEQGEGASRESLREDVMDAMKEDNIEKYDEEIQRYYKSLVE